jgi:dTDP-4-dehydrorhamnose 3,5-epimerase
MPRGKVDGVRQVSFNPVSDFRGSWRRVWDASVMRSMGWDGGVEQVSISSNPHLGTLRGMHSLREEQGEFKFVFCISGAVQDVVIDPRPSSPSQGAYEAFSLTPECGFGVIIPPGCAHGFLTLQPNSVLLYMMATEYRPEHELCYRWNDPFWGIEWEIAPLLISEKDAFHDFIS